MMKVFTHPTSASDFLISNLSHFIWSPSPKWAKVDLNEHLLIYLSIFFFSKIQNGGLFEDDVIFEKKIVIFSKESHLKLNFFQIPKQQSCSTKTQEIPKKLPKKTFQYGGYFHNGVCNFFLCENMSCDRYFCSIELIFGI
jgi:hypothetical protein